MEKTRDNRKSGVFYVLCACTGAFVAFLTPEFTEQSIKHAGLLSSFFAFKIKYLDLLLFVAAGCVVYRLVIEKVRGREAMILFGGLGFIVIRLLLALRHIMY
jgi:hypothetical protein